MQESRKPVTYSSLKVELHLIRWTNLLITFFIQVLCYFVYVNPIWPYDALTGYLFLFLLTVMTMSTAAAGYIINNLMDRDADRLNKKENVLNSELISPQRARLQYLLFVVMGILSSIILIRWSIHFLWINAGISLFLWAYSKYLKRLPLIGNLAVSLFCAGVILIVWYPTLTLSNLPTEMILLIAFAFLITLIREIVKDIEDIDGDREVGDRTLPIVSGILFTKTLLGGLVAMSIGGLLLPCVRNSIEEPIAFVLWACTIGILFFSGIHVILKSKDKSHYHFVSTMLKVAMLTGSLFIVL
jgi:4-hydroxybenzoate polyprenyltransferase